MVDLRAVDHHWNAGPSLNNRFIDGHFSTHQEDRKNREKKTARQNKKNGFPKTKKERHLSRRKTFRRRNRSNKASQIETEERTFFNAPGRQQDRRRRKKKQIYYKTVREVTKKTFFKVLFFA